LPAKGNSAWVAFPSKPQLDRTGVAIRNDAGKIPYTKPLIQFTDRAYAGALSRAAVAAVLEFEPQAFNDNAQSGLPAHGLDCVSGQKRRKEKQHG
jgi:hypothetical protein